MSIPRDMRHPKNVSVVDTEEYSCEGIEIIFFKKRIITESFPELRKETPIQISRNRAFMTPNRQD